MMLCISCRSNLGQIVKCTGIGHSSEYKSTENKNGSIMFRHIFLFVSRLAAKLTHHLTLTVTIEYDTVNERPLLNAVNDFMEYMLLSKT